MRFIFTIIFFLQFVSIAKGQEIVYSPLQKFSRPDEPPLFNIIGKVKNNYIVHHYKKKHFLSIYDQDLQTVKKIKLPFLNKSKNKHLAINYLVYDNFFYFLCQKKTGQQVIFQVAKIDNNGNVVDKAFNIAKIKIAHVIDNSEGHTFYSGITWSEDKSKIVFYNFIKDTNGLTIVANLFDKDWKTIKQNKLLIKDYNSELDFFNNFLISNNGDIVFSRGNKAEGYFINSFQILYKKYASQNLLLFDLPLSTSNILYPKVQVDNVNNQYLIHAYHSTAESSIVNGFSFTKVAVEKYNDSLNTALSLNYNKILKFDILKNNSVKYNFGYYSVQPKNNGSLVLIAKINSIDSNDILFSNKDFYRHQPFPSAIISDNYSKGRGYINAFGAFVEAYDDIPTIQETYPNQNQNTTKKNFTIYQSKSIIKIVGLSNKGEYTKDTTFEITNYVDYKTLRVPYTNKFSRNFLTPFSNLTNTGIFAFNKNINNQYILNKYEVLNENNSFSIQPIKAKYDYFFFNLANAKQVELNKIMIPIVRNNKLGFASINF